MLRRQDSAKFSRNRLSTGNVGLNFEHKHFAIFFFIWYGIFSIEIKLLFFC